MVASVCCRSLPVGSTPRLVGATALATLALVAFAGLAQAAPRGDVFIESRLNGFVLDIEGASTEPAAHVISYPRKDSGADNQIWRLVPAPQRGWFFVESKLNGFVLDIDGANPAPATGIIAYPKKESGSDNQLWRLSRAPAAGYVFIESKLNGFVLDIDGGSREPLARIIAYPKKATGAENQLWRLVEAPNAPAPGPTVAAPAPTSTKEAKEAGPIWNQGDAQAKCPKVCAEPSKWTGQWWTTVQGKMSVCECETPLPTKQAVEAGPLWNQGDAQAKCPGVCRAPARWTGQWWTTVQGKMSVCECETGGVEEVAPPATAPAPAPAPASAVIKQAVEAGPLWNQGDAKRKCPSVCPAPSTWTGQWWTTVQGKMSVCECERPAPVKRAVEAGPIWNQGDAQAKCPGVCKAPATWTGQWWTTVQGKMSVCECEQ